MDDETEVLKKSWYREGFANGYKRFVDLITETAREEQQRAALDFKEDSDDDVGLVSKGFKHGFASAFCNALEVLRQKEPK